MLLTVADGSDKGHLICPEVINGDDYFRARWGARNKEVHRAVFLDAIDFPLPVIVSPR
jgi:hypothetical protein